MEDQRCRNCNFFIQHYALKDGQLFRVHCGHCTFSRVRRKQPDTSVCENYKPGGANEDAFVTKEYLCKELLSYVLNMELLPDIQDEK